MHDEDEADVDPQITHSEAAKALETSLQYVEEHPQREHRPYRGCGAEWGIRIFSPVANVPTYLLGHKFKYPVMRYVPLYELKESEIHVPRKEYYIFHEDGPPPHWHLNVRRFMNESLPHRWIGRMGNADLALQFWPLRCPELTACDFFLVGGT
ncbi:hypothetical protein C0J52_20445 [Blattella germanica]|nr:hypothetical protein C0J52_20445 [Blattella germanica]